MPKRSSVDFEVVVIGSGPAGLFFALEYSKFYPDSKIAIFEKGPDRSERTKDNVTSGWGGAGAFSDGKLTMPNVKYPRSLEIGGNLASIIGEKKFLELVGYVNDFYTFFGGGQEIYEKNEEKVKELVEKASTCDLRLVPARVRHFGSDQAPEIVKNIKRELERRGVKIFLETPVKAFRKNGNKFSIKTAGTNPGLVRSRYLFVAPGRDGAEWLAEHAKKIGLTLLQQTTVDIGVRVEVPYFVLKPVTDYLYDPKFIIDKTECTGDKVRTFCVCPQGHVIIEKYRGILTTVNGHSFEKDISRKSENTNFAVLVSANFDEPFKDPLMFGRHFAEQHNMLSGGVMIQRLKDLTAPEERRSKPERLKEIKDLITPTLKEAVPGDMGFAIPYRFMRSLLEMLKKMNNMVPGIWSKHTLLYAPEVKFYSNQLKASKDLETEIGGLFVGGDGAGLSRGILQASISGIVAARAILKKIEEKK